MATKLNKDKDSNKVVQTYTLDPDVVLAIEGLREKHGISCSFHANNILKGYFSSGSSSSYNPNNYNLCYNYSGVNVDRLTDDDIALLRKRLSASDEK